MELRDLPDDILRLVLKWSLAEGRTLRHTLRANLPLLALCQRWRRLALPAVYSDVFVDYEQQTRPELRPGDNDAPRDKPENAKITTNLGLVASVGCLHAVKAVRIEMSSVANPLAGLDYVIQAMRAAAAVWNSATTLDISIFPGFSAAGRDGVGVAGYEDKIKLIGTALVAMLPRVRRASFCGSRSPIGQALYGQLVEHYADQLCVLDGQVPVAASSGFTLSQLVHANLKYGGGGTEHQLPRVDPARLRSLELSGWPPSRSWAPFSTGDGNMEIEFPNLEYLHLSGNDESTASTIAAWRRSSFPWKLRFPKLKELVMYRTGSAIPLLECAALPSHMDMIRIHATESVLRYVSGLTLPDANELRVGTDHRDPEEADDAAEGAGAEVPAVIAAACRILERAQRAEELVLNIEGNWPRVQPEHITATSITQLIISPVTRVEVMLGMLQRLPCLSYIHFWHLNAEVVEADLSLPGPDEDCAIEPLHTAITTISMHATGYHSSQENSADVAKYLLLKIPTLTGLYAKLTVEAPVMEFVKAYSKRYPRLLNVDLVLAKEGSW